MPRENPRVGGGDPRLEPPTQTDTGTGGELATQVVLETSPKQTEPREGRSGHILPHGLRKTIAVAISCLSSMNYVLYILVLPRASSEPHGAVVFPVQVRTRSSETSSNPLTCTTSQGVSPPSPQSTLLSHPHGPHLPLGPDTWASTAESSLQLTILPLQHANSSARSFTWIPIMRTAGLMD